MGGGGDDGAQQQALDRFCRSWHSRLSGDGPGSRRIYHYTGADGLLGILRDQRVRATNVAFLNDSAEYYLSLERIARALSRFAREAPRADGRFLDGMGERLKRTESAVPAVYVTSFSAASDLLSQWRGYGEVESGYALGFEAQALASGLTSGNALLAPCVYDEGAQDAFADDLVRTVHDLWRHADGGNATEDVVLDTAFDRLAWFAALFKHPGFAEEQEWRLIRLVAPEEVDELHFIPRATCIASYVTVPFACEVLREVWIGPSRHQHLTAPALAALLRQQGFPEDVALRRSGVPFRLV